MADTDDLPKFTLEEYIAYLQAPQYARDGYDSDAEYQAAICTMVKNWHAEAEDHAKEVKDIWKLCYEELKKSPRKSLGGTTEDAIARAKIPILKNSALDEVAALYAGQYAPVGKSLTEPTQPMVAMANRYLKVELKLNRWDSLKFKLGIDGFVCDLWILKIYTLNDRPGPFGKHERIVWDRISPLKCSWDPKAADMRWEDMDYFIVNEDMDPGVAVARFPNKGKAIEDLSDSDRQDSSAGGIMFLTPGTRRRWTTGSSRKRIHIKECWLHDERMVFRAYKYIDVESNEEKIKLDDEGIVQGEWEPAYPYGRMIVTAGDKVVLEDIANPYWHNGLPFVFAQMNPAPDGELLSVGKAASILGIERKVNDVESRVHSYAQSEIERPMEADVGTFPNNVAWYETTGKSRAIVVKNQGKNFIRRAPVEIPQFLGPYLARQQQYRDDISGQPGVLKGQLPEGLQMSAEGLSNVQGTGMSRMSMQSVQIAEAMREAGEKTFWLQRETYREDLKAVIVLPDGSQKEVIWNSNEIPDDFFVEVDIASNAPGGHQMQVNQALTLKRMGVVDRPYVLQTIGIEGWELIDNRMQQHEQQEIVAQGFGRSLGVQVKKYQKEADEGPGPIGKV